MGSAHPPLEYLVTSSNTSLESFELSRLNAVANLRKEIRQVVDDWVEAEIEARIARWVLERRRTDTADQQPDVPQLSEPAPDPRTAARVLQTAEGALHLSQELQESSSEERTASSGRARRVGRASVLHEHSLPRGVDHPADQQLLFEELSYAQDPSVEPETIGGVLQDEVAAGALRSLERFVRVETKILRRNLHDIAIQKAALSDACSETLLLAALGKPQAAGMVVQQSSSTDCDTHTAYVRAGPGRNLVVASSGPGEEAPPQKLGRRCRHSELRPSATQRPPLRHIQLHRFRIATGT
jgi:hypothetical protein